MPTALLDISTANNMREKIFGIKYQCVDHGIFEVFEHLSVCLNRTGQFLNGVHINLSQGKPKARRSMTCSAQKLNTSTNQLSGNKLQFYCLFLLVAIAKNFKHEGNAIKSDICIPVGV